MISRLRQASPQLLLYFLGIAFAGIAGGCFQTSYNNFLGMSSGWHSGGIKIISRSQG